MAISIEFKNNGLPTNFGVKYFLDTTGILYTGIKNNKIILSQSGDFTVGFDPNGAAVDIAQSLITKKNMEDMIKYIKDNYVILKNKKILIEFDPFNIAYELIFEYDKYFNELDDHEKKKLAKTPIVDILNRAVLEQIIEIFTNLNRPFLKKVNWPNNHTFALCLTHDVDELKKTYQYITKTIYYAKKRKLKNAFANLFSLIPNIIKGKNPYWTFDKIEKIEKEHDVRSTFFFLRESAKISLTKPKTWHHFGRKYDWSDKKIKEKMIELTKKGWEIGLHGSFYSYNNIELLLNEKMSLEHTLNYKVLGIRQHHLNLELPLTFKIQQEAGFLYDMSYGFKAGEYIGFKGGVSYPFFPFIDGILEIPTTIMDISINKGYRIEDFYDIIRITKNTGGVCNILWHHSVFSDEYKWDEIYENLLTFGRKMNAWICKGVDLAEWWILRSKTPNIKMRENSIKTNIPLDILNSNEIKSDVVISYEL